MNTTMTSKNTVTRAELESAIYATDAKPRMFAGVYGIVNSVQREDGSGRAFNVTMTTYAPMARTATLFVRLAD